MMNLHLWTWLRRPARASWLVLALLMAGATPAVQAQPYFGAAVGTAQVKDWCSGLTQCRNNETAFKLALGQRLSEHLALELGYLSFGKARGDKLGLTFTAQNRGLGLALVVRAPIAGSWFVQGHLGAAQIETRLGASDGAPDDTDKNIAPYGGLALGYRLGSASSVQAGLDASRSRVKTTTDDVRNSLTMWSVGFSLGF